MTSTPTRVLAVDDEPDTVDWLQLFLQQRGYEVRTAGDARTSEVVCQYWQPDIVLVDLGLPDLDGVTLLRRLKQRLPALDVIVVSGSATVSRTVDAMMAGAFSLIEKPISGDVLLDLIERLRGARVPANVVVPVASEHVAALGRMSSRAPAMKRLFELVRTAAPTDVNVLVCGENGTGKELVASAVHEFSARRENPFVKINCAAIPSDLLESELFGHRKGSFTGAAGDKKGLLELAHRGSVLLDEIGEMPPLLQAKLLRVLQDREIRPIGATSAVRADFRLICATNVDPLEAVRNGRLREDLYFRLNTIVLNLPPLRERTGDLELLAREFLDEFSHRYQRVITGFDERAMARLREHPWPGNVRELQHVVERAVVLASGPQISEADLPENVRASTNGNGASHEVAVPTGCTLEELERLAILQTLEQTRWNKRATADILGIHRPTLYNKLRKYRLWRREDRFWRSRDDRDE